MHVRFDALSTRVVYSRQEFRRVWNIRPVRLAVAGPGRLRLLRRLKFALRMDHLRAPLAFGSDAPVEAPDPFAGMAAAISRTGPDGQPVHTVTTTTYGFNLLVGEKLRESFLSRLEEDGQVAAIDNPQAFTPGVADKFAKARMHLGCTAGQVERVHRS
mgnify:CR=1 FL=1